MSAMESLTAITMPKWGLMMEEGTVTAWLAKEGTKISEGDEIAEIETSKITNVMEAPAAGSLLRIVLETGRAVPVGELIAVVGPADADPADIDAFVDTFEISADAGEGDIAGGPVVRTLEVDGRTIAAAELGEGDPPLVLVHGFGGDRNNWLFNLDTWAKARRVIALDLPGHGASSKDVRTGDLAELAGAVAGALDQLGVSRAIFVGHSMGAGVCLQLAADRPELVAGLVAISGFGFGGEVSSEFVERFVTAERRKDLSGAVEMLFADPGLATREMVDQLLAFKRTDGVQGALESIAAQSLAPGSAAKLVAQVAALGVPVLAIHGDADQVITPPSSLPDSIERKALPGIGHMAHMEAAGEVTQAVAAFAERVG